MEENEYHRQAETFLAKHGLTFRAVLSDTKPARWSPSGHHYRVTLGGQGEDGQPRTLRFDFWGSQADKEAGRTQLHAYDVLACISGDQQYTSHDEVWSSFGEDARGLDVDAIVRFARRMHQFFTPEELEDLMEIQ